MELIKTTITDNEGNEFTVNTNYEITESMKKDMIKAREEVTAREKANQG